MWNPSESNPLFVVRITNGLQSPLIVIFVGVILREHSFFQTHSKVISAYHGTERLRPLAGSSRSCRVASRRIA
jgi:hypothetical protein